MLVLSAESNGGSGKAVEGGPSLRNGVVVGGGP